MVKLFYTLTILLSLLAITSGYAQQDPISRMYWNNYSVINPANSGFEKTRSLIANYRQQNSEAANHSFWGSADAFFGALNSGIGVNYYYNEFYIQRFNEFRLNYNFQFFIKKKHHFSIGCAIGISRLTTSPGYRKQSPYYHYIEIGSPGYMGPAGVGKLNLGLSYQFKRFTLGFSATNINEPELYVTEPNWSIHYWQYRRNHLYVSYQLRLSENLEIVPSFLLTEDQVRGKLLDVNTRMFFRERYFIGMALNNYNSFALQCGIEFWDKLMLAYSYEGRDNERYFANSHEISLAFSIDKD